MIDAKDKRLIKTGFIFGLIAISGGASAPVAVLAGLGAAHTKEAVRGFLDDIFPTDDMDNKEGAL